MNKQQINYLTEKLRSKTSAVIRERERATIEAVNDCITSALTAAGFKVCSEDNRYARILNTVRTDDLLATEKRMKEDDKKFAAALNAELSTTIDTIHLGSSEDAMAILDRFNAKIAELESAR